MNQTPKVRRRLERANTARAAITASWRAAIPRARRGAASGLTALLLFVVAGSSVISRSAYAENRASAPLPGQSAAQSERASANNTGTASNELTFSDAVLPILKKTCVSCHGPEKVKAGLRLDTFEGIKKGGDNGAVIKPGKSKSSPLIQRLLLPLKHDDHMPPADKPQPTAEEIALLRRWVDAGASGDGQATTKLNPSIQPQPALASNQNAK